jgi:hypothetical protein
MPSLLTRAAERSARKAVQLPAHNVAKRVAGQGVSRQKNYVEQQDKSSDPYPNSSVKKESAERIAPKKDQEDEPHVEKVAVEILQNKRE